jgi:CMP-N-acetylneuraminic acid synthetase
MDRFLAIITARGGSKRVPRKNILPLGGMPLIAHTIKSAKDSKYITDVVVSTDDEEIRDISIEFGAEVPFLRPEYLSNDTAKSIDVVIYTIDELSKIGREYDYIVLLQPTSPFRTSTDIDNSIDFLYSKDANGIVSLTNTNHNPTIINILPDDLSMEGFIRDDNIRTQDMPKYYRINGAIYITKTNILREYKSFFNCPLIYGFIMEESHSIDIDTMFDFDFARFMFDKIK